MRHKHPNLTKLKPMKRPFTETKANRDALTRLVRARWANIVKACRALGLPVPRKPSKP